MRILLFGKNGQVGWELQRSLALQGEVIALGRDSADFCGDLTNLQGIRQTILDFRPNVVFNAAAYTAVDKAESDYQTAGLVNRDAVGAMANACKEINALLVHYSTDYVFDGSGTQYRDEKENTNPINEYGKTKLAGEKQIISSGCTYLIFRTSWVYGIHGKNFIKTILRLSKTKQILNVVADQIGAPTSADFIADVSASLAINLIKKNENPKEIFNLVPDGVTSWCDFAKWIVETKADPNNELKPENINPISTQEYPVPAARPHNSRLLNEKLKKYFPKGIADWKYYAKRVLDCL